MVYLIIGLMCSTKDYDLELAWSFYYGVCILVYKTMNIFKISKIFFMHWPYNFKIERCLLG